MTYSIFVLLKFHPRVIMIWFILFLFVFKTYFVQYIVNLRIKCVTETRNVSILFCKNLKSSFSNYMAHTFVSEVSLHSWLIWPTVCIQLASLGPMRFYGQRTGSYYIVNFCSGMMTINTCYTFVETDSKKIKLFNICFVEGSYRLLVDSLLLPWVPWPLLAQCVFTDKELALTT